HSWGRSNIGLGDSVMLTEMEHHSNIVPWQLLARDKGAQLKYVGISDDGHLSREDFHANLENGGVKLFAVTQASNVLGTITPVQVRGRNYRYLRGYRPRSGRRVSVPYRAPEH